MFDPDHAVFLAIAEAGSVSAAARADGASTASYSKRLARLEARLGTRLIHRTTRRLALTPRGAAFHRELVAIRDALAAAESQVADTGGTPFGPLRLTAPTSFGRLHLAPVLAAYARQYPRVSLEVDLSDTAADLLSGRYDFALRISPTPDSALASERLAANRRVLCAAPGYLAERGEPADLAALAGHALLAADGQLPWILDGPGGTTRFAGRSAVRTNSSELVRELALSGAGIALRSLWDVAGELAAGTLIRVLPAWEGSRDAGLHVVRPPAQDLSPAARALVAMLQRAFVDGRAPWDGG